LGKILSRAGVSLADVYDVEGSIVGVDTLETKEVNLTHEMGGTIFSERAVAFMLLISPGTVAQTLAFVATSSAPPDSVNRILGVSMYAEVAGRIAACNVNILGPGVDGEIPIAVWDGADDPERRMRITTQGAAVANVIEMAPANGVHTPTLQTRAGVANTMQVLTFRGSTESFGAGTVTPIAIVHILRAHRASTVPGTPSSHGLPYPSW